MPRQFTADELLGALDRICGCIWHGPEQQRERCILTDAIYELLSLRAREAQQAELVEQIHALFDSAQRRLMFPSRIVDQLRDDVLNVIRLPALLAASVPPEVQK